MWWFCLVAEYELLAVRASAEQGFVRVVELEVKCQRLRGYSYSWLCYMWCKCLSRQNKHVSRWHAGKLVSTGSLVLIIWLRALRGVPQRVEPGCGRTVQSVFAFICLGCAVPSRTPAGWNICPSPNYREGNKQDINTQIKIVCKNILLCIL
jgi:hypothetical protein